MPESKFRRKATGERSRTAAASGPNPTWYKVVMFGLMIVGLLWIITYYISESRFPIATLGSWNIMIGFGIAIVGFLMTTRWR